ncbi:MAG: chromosomal replication initiator protein DnaA [Akkermansiaceae bacterium]
MKNDSAPHESFSDSPNGVMGENNDEAKKLWKPFSEELTKLVGENAYGRWFESGKLTDLSETEAVLALESDIHQVWVEANYLPETQAALAAVSDLPRKLRVVVREGEEKKLDPAVDEKKDEEPSLFTTEEVSEIPDTKTQDKQLKSVGLNPQFNFDRFVVGINNTFAHSICQAVATGQGSVYNPLFIHGGTGLGKTHLMQAIGQRMLKENPKARVVYLTSEKFANEFIELLRKGSLERFRRKYRRADILLIDDIQFLVNKERTQEEFFHTFNALLDLQSQIVITSDRPASEIKNMEPRLISRFESGITVELQRPGIETRLAILQRKMEEWKVKLPADILEMIAERIQSNVRRMEGALVRVATYASLGTDQLTMEKAEFLLKDILHEEGKRRVNINDIQKVVTEQFDLRLSDMTSKSRPNHIAFPRQIAMYLSRKMTECSLVEIGEAFGGRDHGTVIYACRKVNDRMGSEPRIRDEVELITATLERK